jgi:hypothetical protein
VGLQEAHHLQDLKQNHFASAESRISKKEFFVDQKSRKAEAGRLNPSKQRLTKQWFELEHSNTK